MRTTAMSEGLQLKRFKDVRRKMFYSIDFQTSIAD